MTDRSVTRLKLFLPVLFAALAAPALAEPELNPGNFAALHKQIKPQPGESRWMEVPWLIDLHEARQKASAQGKPIFVMSGGGATAIGPC
jgi:hypothetical protein